MEDINEVESNRRTDVRNMLSNNDDEQRRKDREDAERYRTRKEVRDQLVVYAAIVAGTLTIVYTIMQIIGG